MVRYFMIAVLILLTACSKDKDNTPCKARQSVLVYIAGDNNLNSFVRDDIRQMIEGSRELGKDCNLLLYVDQENSLPYILKVANGDTTMVKTFAEEHKSSDAATLADAMRWMTENYEAENYGLVLWGHADGWIIEKARGPRKAYGQDTTGGEQWMNIPDMAKALEGLPAKEGGGKLLRFIFADCCCFQSVESAYELRNCTDYIIASAAEIPGEGAPYHTIIPALFNQSDDFCRLAADAYYEQVSYGYQEPISVVKTSEIENLAQATRSALEQSLQPMKGDGTDYPDTDGLIYYFENSLFDMNDFMLRHCNENVYREWKRTLDKALIYKTVVPVWMANFVTCTDTSQMTFLHFTITDERFSCLSMFVPQDPENAYNKCMEETWNPQRFYMASRWREDAKNQNENISKMQWYKAAGLDAMGW